MASTDKVTLLTLKEAENRKDSEKLVRKFEPDVGGGSVEKKRKGEEEEGEPSAVTTPPVAAAAATATAALEEGEKAAGERQGESGQKKKKKKKRETTAEEREKEKTVRALLSFLPKHKKKAAREFLANLTEDPQVVIRENRILHRGEERGHVLEALSRLFLPAGKFEAFYRAYLGGKERRPKDFGHLSLEGGRV